MKKLIIPLLLILSLPSFAQNSCCSQWITSKTNGQMFACINTKANEIFTGTTKYGDLIPGGSYYTENGITRYSSVPVTSQITTIVNYTFAPNQVYGYNGSYVKVFTNPYPTSPASGNSVVVLDDACNLICSWGNNALLLNPITNFVSSCPNTTNLGYIYQLPLQTATPIYGTNAVVNK